MKPWSSEWEVDRSARYLVISFKDEHLGKYSIAKSYAVLCRTTTQFDGVEMTVKLTLKRGYVYASVNRSDGKTATVSLPNEVVVGNREVKLCTLRELKTYPQVVIEVEA